MPCNSRHHEEGEVEGEFAEEEEGSAAVAGIASDSAMHPPHEQEFDEERHGEDADNLQTAAADAEG